jgi:hypothetical protein
VVTSEQNSTAAPPARASVPPTRNRVRPRCAFCGKEAREPMLFSSVRLAIAKSMSAEHPNLTAGDTICGRHVSDYRTRKVAGLLERECGELSELEHQVWKAWHMKRQ